MTSKPLFDEKRLRDAKMLQQEFSKSGSGKRFRGQAGPLPSVSRNSRGASVYSVQSGPSGRPRGGQQGCRHIPQQNLVAQPNLNAVPAARADKDMQDWLNGVSYDKEKKDNVRQPVHKAEKSPRPDENAMPRNAPKSAQAKTTTQTLSNQTEKIAERKMAPTESTPSKKLDLNTPVPVEALKQSSVPTTGIVVGKERSASTQNSRADEPGCSPASGSVDDADEFAGLTIVAQWHLRRQARRKEGAETKVSDLLDVNSPPLTPPSNFFDKGDMPLSLPAPIVPSRSSHEAQSCHGAPTTPSGEDLMQFPDPNPGKGFGLLIPDSTECRAAEGSSIVYTETRVQPPVTPATGHEVKTVVPVSAEMRLGAAAAMKAHGSSGHPKGQTEQSIATNGKVETGTQAASQAKLCVCNIDKPTTTFRGLSSSKWANPGYHHRGDLPRNTEMLNHKPTCPARIAWEKKHPLESGATLTVQSRVTHLPENFQLVNPPKSKRLSAYALPFRPLEH